MAVVLAGRTGPRRPGRTHGGLTMSAAPGTGGTVGIVANPVSGKDIRRLVANAPSSTLAEKYTIVRRLVIGATAAGADRFWFLDEPHRICAKAVETLDLDGVGFGHVPVELRFDESDTVRTVAAMRELGCAVVVVLGGDGTSRAATLGWRDVPLVPLSTGTNNAFPRFVEATVAGVSHFGDVLQYVVRSAHRDLLVLVPRTNPARFAVDDRVWCSWSAEDVYLFSARQADVVMASPAQS